MKRYDALMIGFGKGAKTLAADFGKRGKRVAMIEKSNEMYGGTCINEGCIPSKSLIKQADVMEYQEAVKQKEILITKLRAKNYDKLNQMETVDIYTAEASFLNDHEIQIAYDGKTEVLYGEYIFINTGSEPVMPEIKGIKEIKNVYTSASLMKREELPEKLAVLGGGYIGLEFAGMYARYGAEVTVFEHGDRLIKREDADVAAAIQKTLEAQGVSFIFSFAVEEVSQIGESVQIAYTQNGIQKTDVFDALLMATGRRAATKSLHLENAGVAIDERGNIKTDEYLRTSKKHIYAMGDVKGGLQFTYISLDDDRIVKSHLFEDGARTTKNRGPVAYSMFTTPAFSRVGLSENEALAQGYTVKTAVMPAAAIPRANVVNRTDGLLKAVVDAKTNQILGCVLFCESSEEMINLVSLAMKFHIKADDIANHIYTHPTMSEALNDLFGSFI